MKIQLGIIFHTGCDSGTIHGILLAELYAYPETKNFNPA